MNIANQGFPATRADLNNALQAIATNNSGTSAPSTTFANQWWYDTTNNKLYIRNEANNAWIEVAVLDQTNNEWQITTGVIQAKDGDGLALKTDDGTTRLFIKDSDGSIGIGHASPTAQLHVKGSDDTDQVIIENTDAAANSAPDLVLYRNSASPAAADSLGRIDFRGKDDAGNDTNYAVIMARLDDPANGSEDARLRFYVASAGEEAVTTDTEALAIISPEDLRINPSADTSDNTQLLIVGGTSGTSRVLFGDTSDVDVGEVEYNHSDNRMRFRVGAIDNIMSLTSSDIGFGTDDPTSFEPSNIGQGRMIVNSASSGGTWIANRNDTTATGGNHVGSYLMRSMDTSGVKFGGMVGTVDDTAGNFHLDFHAGRDDTDTSGTEPALRINDANSLWQKMGNYYLGRTDDGTYAASEVFFGAYYASDTYLLNRVRNGTGGDYVFLFQRSGTIKAEIEENGDFLSATNSYGSTSDERLKENIEASGSQWDDIKALQIKKYSMKEDNLDAPNMLGVIAQDLQASGMNGLVKSHTIKDAEDNPILDDNGKEQNFLSVKYSILYMKAVRALQEAMVKIETLETETTAIKARLDALEG